MSEVYESNTYLHGYCNTGTSITNLKGKFGKAIFGEEIESWVHHGIANIISIPVMKKLGFHISYNSDDVFWVVTKEDITAIPYKDEQ